MTDYPTDKVTRVEVIDGQGRAYVNWDDNIKVQLSFQDDGRTLKVFIGHRGGTEMTTTKDTYEYCENLIQKEIDEVFVTVSSWSRECADHNEEFISFKQRKSEELKNLYKHLDHIQKLKTSYLTGR